MQINILVRLWRHNDIVLGLFFVRNDAVNIEVRFLGYSNNGDWKLKFNIYLFNCIYSNLILRDNEIKKYKNTVALSTTLGKFPEPTHHSHSPLRSLFHISTTHLSSAAFFLAKLALLFILLLIWKKSNFSFEVPTISAIRTIGKLTCTAK